MARAARHLLEGALRTQKAEDRLTEILAVALQEHGAFRDCFLERPGSRWELERMTAAPRCERSD